MSEDRSSRFTNLMQAIVMFLILIAIGIQLLLLYYLSDRIFNIEQRQDYVEWRLDEWEGRGHHDTGGHSRTNQS